MIRARASFADSLVASVSSVASVAFCVLGLTLSGAPAVAQDDPSKVSAGDSGKWSPLVGHEFDGTWTVDVKNLKNPKFDIHGATLVISGAAATYQAIASDPKWEPCANRQYSGTVEQRNGRKNTIRVRIDRAATLPGCTEIVWPFKLSDGKLVWESDTQVREASRK